MPKPKARTQIIVSVDDSHVKNIKDVAKRLRARGLVVKEVMEQIGAITGSIERDKIKSLAKLNGVSAVEESQTYQLPPPDSDVQ